MNRVPRANLSFSVGRCRNRWGNDHNHETRQAARNLGSCPERRMEIARRCVDRQGDYRRRSPQNQYRPALGRIAPESRSASLSPRFLLDTHILVYWLAAPKRLSREQLRVLREAVRHREPVAISAITLLEIAVLFGEGSTRSDVPIDQIFDNLESNPAFQIVPFTPDVASEVAAAWGRPEGPRRSCHCLYGAYPASFGL
jgi:PIN domain nuclease of toxin-antitoxin system